MLLFSRGVQAQPPIWTIEDPHIAICTIELERLLTLGDSQDPHLYHGFSTVAMGPGPVYYLAGGFTPGVVLRYDDQGTLRGTIGRLGEGPGEIPHGAAIALTSQDSLLVAGGGLVRVFVPSTGMFVRSWRVETPIVGMVPLTDGGIAAPVGPNPALETVVVMNADGSPRFPVGFDGILEHRDQLWQRAHAGRDGSTLVSHTGRYRIREFTPAGELSWTLERSAGWFIPYPRQPAGAGIVVPSLPDVIAAWLDPENRLWVLLERAAEPFQPMDQSHASPQLANVSAQFDSHLEVIDLASRTVIASQRTRWLRPVTGGTGVLHSTESTAEGYVRFTLWEPRLDC